MKTKSLKMKLARIFAGLVIVLLSATSVFAYSDFDTTEYDVKADVTENGLVKIQEDISVYIPGEMHGIYRYIPMSKDIGIKGKDGKTTTKTIPFKISDVQVKNDPYETYTESGNLVIQIGDADEYISGKKDYSFSYTGQLYDDGTDEYDAFIYNVLPQDWATPIKSASIVLNMPKEFDTSHLKVYCGQSGSTETLAEGNRTNGYLTDGQKVVIHAENLEQGEGITVAVKLPQGYFKDLPNTAAKEMLVAILGIILAALALLLWFLFGRDRKIIKTVEFESPDGISPSEVGYIVDGSADKKDVLAMIFDLAQKGYLSITETDDKDIIITKENDLPPDAKGYERTFFYGLLAEGNGSSVAISGIDKSFYDTYKATTEQIREIYTTDPDRRIFPKSAIAGRAVAILIGLVGYFSAGVLNALTTGEWNGTIIFLFPALFMVFACLAGGYATDNKFSASRTKLVAANAGSIAMLAVAALAVGGMVKMFVGSFPVMISMVVLTVCVYFASRFMMRRTKYGTDIMGRILGFRDFIELAEVDKLKAMVEENPSYFFDILPYAYVFGLSKKWAKKFEKIPTRQPYWYHGYYGNDVLFNTMLFYHMFNRFDNMARESIHIPTDSGGGGFGGFSGGGFGGGGGGGW